MWLGNSCVLPVDEADELMIDFGLIVFVSMSLNVLAGCFRRLLPLLLKWLRFGFGSSFLVNMASISFI